MRAYVATVLVAVLAVVTGARAQLAPEQVHLAAGMTPDLMNVMWVTQYGEVPVRGGAHVMRARVSVLAVREWVRSVQ